MHRISMISILSGQEYNLMRKGILAILFIISFNTQTNACRFTVREIGFSTLSQDIYSLVVIDHEADATDRFWQSIRDRLEDSNINLRVLNPVTDADHPLVKQIINSEISLPALVLVAPDGRMLELNASRLSEQVELVLDSPIRRRISNDFADVFSVILWIDGKDEVKNSEADSIIVSDCDRIENIIPYMPKKVSNGPMSIHISAGDFKAERVLLWSLGIDKLPDEPVAFVLYGRGRIMGDAVNASEISEGRLYKYMSMIGADCECGLDRRWMLGNQIPLLWPSVSRQQLVSEVGFDVDNPMILAEMSRILAKETNPNVAGDLGYGIEVIDLNSVFDHVQEIEYDEPELKTKLKPMLITMVLFTLLVVAIGLFFFFRNKNK